MSGRSLQPSLPMPYCVFLASFFVGELMLKSCPERLVFGVAEGGLRHTLLACRKALDQQPA